MRSRRACAVLSVVALVGVAVVTTAAPAGAVDVSNEAEFRAAWATATDIQLEHDIVLRCANGGAATRTANGDVSVHGDGHTIRVEPGCIDRVLEVVLPSTSSVTLRNVTIRDGRVAFTTGPLPFGGGILILGTGSLTLVDSLITDNEACRDGGGIDMEGGSSGASLTIVRSTIADNTSLGVGGGVWGGSVRTIVVNSTITDNDADRIGALVVPTLPGRPGGLELQYADIVDNTSTPDPPTFPCGGGGSGTDAQHVSHATDVGVAAFGDAQLAVTSLEAFASVLSGPIANCEPLFAPTTTSNGYNRASDSTCGLTAETDKQNFFGLDLGPLRDNGGPTPTLLPGDDSPLVDQIREERCEGPDGDIDTDQRGVERPQNERCDIGAVEVEVNDPVPPAPAPVVVVEPSFTG